MPIQKPVLLLQRNPQTGALQLPRLCACTCSALADRHAHRDSASPAVPRRQVPNRQPSRGKRGRLHDQRGSSRHQRGWSHDERGRSHQQLCSCSAFCSACLRSRQAVPDLLRTALEGRLPAAHTACTAPAVPPLPALDPDRYAVATGYVHATQIRICIYTVPRSPATPTG